MSPSVDEEWGVLHGGVNMIVVCEFSHQQPIVPVILSLIHEDVKMTADPAGVTSSSLVETCLFDPSWPHGDL